MSGKDLFDNKSLHHCLNEIARIEFQNKLKSARTHQEEKSAKNALNQFSICSQIIDSPALQLLRIRALM